jgi:hypothetical protein
MREFFCYIKFLQTQLLMTADIKYAVVVQKYGLVDCDVSFVSKLIERIVDIPAYEMRIFANQWRVQSVWISFHKVPWSP